MITRQHIIGYLVGVITTVLLLVYIYPNINEPKYIQVPCNDSIPEADTITKEASYYNPVKNQTDNTPLITANGTKLHKNIKSVAISRDLRAILPYGSKIKLIYPKHLSGVYIVNDCMNARFKNKIDIFVWKGKLNVDSVTFIKV